MVETREEYGLDCALRHWSFWDGNIVKWIEAYMMFVSEVEVRSPA
jgi:hypothetical protein